MRERLRLNPSFRKFLPTISLYTQSLSKEVSMQGYKLSKMNRAILELLDDKIKAILRSEMIFEEDVDSIQHEAAELDLENEDKIET